MVLPLDAKVIVVHLDDDAVDDPILRHKLKMLSIRYEHVTLQSEAEAYLGAAQVIGMVLDWRLHPESRHGQLEFTSRCLIERVRTSPQYRDLPIVVLTHYRTDPELQSLVTKGLLQADQIFSKLTEDDETAIDLLLSRLLGDASDSSEEEDGS